MKRPYAQDIPIDVLICIKKHSQPTTQLKIYSFNYLAILTAIKRSASLEKKTTDI